MAVPEHTTSRLQLVALATALACVLFAGGCIPIPLGPKAGGSAPSSTSTSMGPSATATTAPATVGETLNGGEWRVTVTHARLSGSGPGGARAGSGKTWLLIETEFINTRLAEAVFVNPKDATIVGTAGKTYATTGTTFGFNGHGMRLIGPGLGGGTVFAFRVPKGTSGYVFTFTPKSGVKRVKLQWDVP